MSSSDDELPPEAVPLGAAPASGGATGGAADDRDAHATSAKVQAMPLPATVLQPAMGGGHRS